MKSNIKFHVTLLFIYFFGIHLNAQTTLPFITPGTTTWTVPACVTSITVQAWAGGGGGGAGGIGGGLAGIAASGQPTGERPGHAAALALHHDGGPGPFVE